MTAMLASVRTLDEALFAFEAGADFIDLKEPSQGALGALDHAAVRVCVQAIDGRRPVSATIGDIVSMDPGEMTAAVARMAATGVDYIKIGFFAQPPAFACVDALTALAQKTRLVAVMFADESYDLALIDSLARAGFAGAMLDTAHKTGKTLREWRKDRELREFVKRARGHGLLTGLAGSLRKEDIASLLTINPDYLGFRGALCSGSDRNQSLHAKAFAGIRGAIPELESMSISR